MNMRLAAVIGHTASQFESKVQIKANDKTVDAKRILMIKSLRLVKDTEVTISASGSDEKEAVDALIDLINKKFG